jgi:4-amino-4-deoxy-L-arabinose transferase-like glycosyltransferase
VVLFTVAGALLRFHHIEKRQFWGDEVHTYQVANEPNTLRELFAIWWDGKLMIDPPTYYVMSFFNIHASSSHNELRLRVFSLLFGVLAIPLTFLLTRRLATRWDAVAATGLMAVCTFAIQYSQEYRPYSMLLFATILFLHAMACVWDGWSAKKGLYLYATAALLLYTHLFGGFVLAASYPILLWATWRPHGTAKQRLPLLPILGLPVAMTLLYLPMFAWGIKVIRYTSPRFGTGENVELNKALHKSFAERTGYFKDLLYSFAAWRLGTISQRWYAFILSLLGAGLIRLLLFRWRMCLLLVLWLAISLVMSFGFYEYMQYPYEPRRNIIDLPPFLYLLTLGIGLPAALAFRFVPRSWVVKGIGILLSAALFSTMCYAWWQNYQRYDSHGFRNEVNQADWRGIADFVATHAEPDHVVAIPIKPETWQRLHYMFYHESRSKHPVDFLSTLPELATASNQWQRPVWFIVSQPWTYPKDLFEYLVSNGQWFNYFGGSVVFLPPKRSEVPGQVANVFAVAQACRAAIGGDRQLLTGDLVLTGPTTGKYVLDEMTSAVVVDLKPGVYQATLSLAVNSSTGTLRLFPVLSSGQPTRTMDFSKLDPVSSVVNFLLHEGEPYLFLQHNGIVWFHYFLEKPGLYRFTLNAKHDRPGPVGVRLFMTMTPEPEKMWFDKKDNSFGNMTRDVRLQAGRNELRIYYDSFNRAEIADTYEDYTNAFESTYWKLQRIGD